MVLTPSTSSSRLSALKNARNSVSRKSTGISEYLRKKPILPQHQIPSSQSHQRSSKPQQEQTLPQRQKQKNPILSDSQNAPTSVIHGNKILEGVVACLDVRTEDGDDVSQNFERALQSMGAKTRRTFSDSVTHLIFKNGSPATLKKALSKNAFIINLLWISRCKREGKRLPEKDFIIERPQGLVLAGKKRRKSMEPGKVRALVDLEPSLSSSSDSSQNEEASSLRRKTIATSSWTARDFSRRGDESESRKRHIEEAELDAEQELLPPRLSLPISVESIASRHTDKRLKSNTNIIPIHAPSETMKEQIKARFSIGQAPEASVSTSSIDTKSLNINPIQISTSSPSSIATPIKRKRKLTGNLSKASVSSTSSINSSELPQVNLEKPTSNTSKTPTIVITSATASVRKQCVEIIKKLGKFELATEVTENTTHVLVGAQRRTKTVTLGLLRGAWMLKPQWLIDSGAQGEYASETSYELLDWYPRAEAARNRVRLLPSSTHIRVLSSTSDVTFIEELVRMAGGSVVYKNEQADLIISDQNVIGVDKPIVTDNWLFESIEQWQYAPIEKYKIKV